MSHKISLVIAYSLYNITLQKYFLFSNTAAATPTVLGVIESYPTVMLPTLTELPGVTLVLVDGQIFTQSSNPELSGVTLEVVGGPPLVTHN